MSWASAQRHLYIDVMSQWTVDRVRGFLLVDRLSLPAATSPAQRAAALTLPNAQLTGLQNTSAVLLIMYLRNVIATQPPRSTRSSSVVTLLHPPVQLRLKVTNRSFRCAAPLLWNKLPYSLCTAYQSDPTHSSSLSSSPDPRSAVNLSHGVVRSRLKTHLFSKSFLLSLSLSLSTDLTDYCPAGL